MCLTPGPNVVLATASAANFGFRRTIPQISGVTAGFGVHGASCSFSNSLVYQRLLGGRFLRHPPMATFRVHVEAPPCS